MPQLLRKLTKKAFKLCSNLHAALLSSRTGHDLLDRSLFLDIHEHLAYRDILCIANTFALAGFRVVFHTSKSNFFRYDLKQIVKIPNLTMSFRRPQNTKTMVLATDADDYDAYNWKQVYKLSFVPEKYCRDDSDSFKFPYSMHPNIYLQYHHDRKLDSLRQNDRSCRIFFSGNVSADYSRSKFLEKYALMDRPRILEIYKSRPDIALHTDGPSIREILKSCQSRGVFFDSSAGYINQQYWLESMSLTDFFLCPPGVVIPMCHNAIEAMAVGTIPIINYPDWFSPKLVHNRNCLAFQSEDDLRSCIDRAMRLTEDEILQMRKSVIDYYDRYLDPRTALVPLRVDPRHEVSVSICAELQSHLNQIA